MVTPSKRSKSQLPEIFSGTPIERGGMTIDLVDEPIDDSGASEMAENSTEWEPANVWVPLGNVFCPTGAGGGIDPTCSPGGDEPSGRVAGVKLPSPIVGEPKTPPPPGKSYSPDVEKDVNRDGVTESARVGVPAMSVPPPPKIGRIPNLTPRERAAEKGFVDLYESNSNGVARTFRRMVETQARSKGDVPTFGTDDAKALAVGVWTGVPNEERSQNRATLNTALHQTANAIAKRAFVQHLDTLKPGDEIMVTVGGCGAGKGFALKNVDEAKAMKKSSKVVWDSAGDQNATENPWILQEAEKRGLKVNYVYVHADPKTQWAHPERGVVKRAGDPNDGRMVDAKVFADSYALGAKNHQAFTEKNTNNPNVKFMFLENSGKPKLLDGIPKEALAVDRKELEKFAVDAVDKTDAPEHVKRGAKMGQRIWGKD